MSSVGEEDKHQHLVGRERHARASAGPRDETKLGRRELHTGNASRGKRMCWAEDGSFPLQQSFLPIALAFITMESSDSNKRLKASNGAPISTSPALSGAARLPAYHPPAAQGARGSG